MGVGILGWNPIAGGVLVQLAEERRALHLT